MAVASCSYSFVLIFFMSLVSFPHFLNASVSDACTKAAALDPNIFNRDFCVTSLQVDPTCTSATYVGLAQIAINLASKNVTSTMAKMQNLLAKPGNGKKMKTALSTCLELYSGTINDLSEAAGAIGSSHYADAKSHLSAAIRAPFVCEYTFSEKDITSVFSEEDANAEQLSAMALAFINI